MATEVVKTIGFGGDYSTIAAWFADRQGNLVARDTIEIGELLSGQHYFSGYLDGYGSTVDSSHYFVLRASQTSRFKGCGYHFPQDAYITPYLNIYYLPYTRLLNFKIYSSYLFDGSGLYLDSCNNSIVDGLHISLPESWIYYSYPVNYTGIYIYDSSVVIRNCVVHLRGLNIHDEHAHYYAGIVTNAKVYNCTCIINDYRYMYSQATIYGVYGIGALVKNTCAIANMYCFGGSFASGSCNNASIDNTAPGSNSLYYIPNVYETFLISILNCVRLKTWSNLIGAGVDLSNEGFNWDAVGQTRSNPWDIGAIECIVKEASNTVSYRIGSSGQAHYSTIASCLADQVSDLIFRDIVLELQLEGQTHTVTYLNLASYLVTDPYHYLKIIAVSGAEFNGDIGNASGKAIIDGVDANFYLDNIFTYIKNVLFKRSTLYFYGPSNYYWGSFVIDGCGIYDMYGRALYAQCGSYYPGTFRNSVIHKIYSNYSTYGALAYRVYFYNDTIYGITSTSQYPYYSVCGLYASYSYVYNCAVGNVTGGNPSCFYVVSCSADYNASSDNTAPGSNSLRNVNMAAQFVNVQTDYFDCHLLETSVLKNAGANLSSYGFNWDIDGDTRPSGTAWDIGADEYLETVSGDLINIPKLTGSGLIKLLSLLDASVCNIPKLSGYGISKSPSVIDSFSCNIPRLFGYGISKTPTAVDSFPCYIPKLLGQGIPKSPTAVDSFPCYIPKLSGHGIAKSPVLSDAFLCNLSKIYGQTTPKSPTAVDSFPCYIPKLSGHGIAKSPTLSDAFLCNLSKIYGQTTPKLTSLIDATACSIPKLNGVGTPKTPTLLDASICSLVRLYGQLSLRTPTLIDAIICLIPKLNGIGTPKTPALLDSSICNLSRLLANAIFKPLNLVDSFPCYVPKLAIENVIKIPTILDATNCTLPVTQLIVNLKFISLSAEEIIQILLTYLNGEVSIKASALLDASVCSVPRSYLVGSPKYQQILDDTNCYLLGINNLGLLPEIEVYDSTISLIRLLRMNGEVNLKDIDLIDAFPCLLLANRIEGSLKGFFFVDDAYSNISTLRVTNIVGTHEILNDTLCQLGLINISGKFKGIWIYDPFVIYIFLDKLSCESGVKQTSLEDDTFSVVGPHIILDNTYQPFAADLLSVIELGKLDLEAASKLFRLIMEDRISADPLVLISMEQVPELLDVTRLTSSTLNLSLRYELELLDDTRLSPYIKPVLLLIPRGSVKTEARIVELESPVQGIEIED